jgi:hypothetical protein
MALASDKCPVGYSHSMVVHWASHGCERCACNYGQQTIKFNASADGATPTQSTPRLSMTIIKGIASAGSSAAGALGGFALGLCVWAAYWHVIPTMSPWDGPVRVLADGTRARQVDPWEVLAYLVTLLLRPLLGAGGGAVLGWDLPRRRSRDLQS